MKTKILLFATLLAMGCQKRSCYLCKGTSYIDGLSYKTSHYSLCDATEEEKKEFVKNSSAITYVDGSGRLHTQSLTCEKQ